MKSNSRLQPEIIISENPSGLLAGGKMNSGPFFERTALNSKFNFPGEPGRFQALTRSFACRRLAMAHPPTNNPPVIRKLNVPGSGTGLDTFGQAV